MMFLNEYEIDRTAETLRSDPVMGPATRFLADFRDQVNGHSDGWAYWPLPVRAAKSLMTLIQNAENAKRGRFDARHPVEPVTAAAVKAAMRPIKSFYTRRGYAAGMKMPDINLPD